VIGRSGDPAIGRSGDLEIAPVSGKLQAAGVTSPIARSPDHSITR
jgi:hypothetical protein